METIIVGKAGAKAVQRVVVGLLFCFLAAAPASGQQEARSLRIWVDTLNLGLCGERTFDERDFGVWLESSTETDTVVGFRLQDSVVAMSLTLQWDTSRIRLTPPYILTDVQTIFGRYPSKTQFVDTNSGVLYVTVSSDVSLRPAIGSNIPLFYLKGYVREADTPVGMPAGGARVQSVEIEGTLGDNLGTIRFLPGFVQVLRDTTPEYTGYISTTLGNLDTNRRDTIDVIATNIGERRVKRLAFSLEADPTSFRFVETLELDRLGLWGWNVSDILLDGERIEVALEADAPIASVSDSVLFKVVVERTSDSAFSSEIVIEDIELNSETCLGRMSGGRGTILAARIPLPPDTVDTITMVVERDERRTRVRGYWSGEGIRLSGSLNDIEAVTLYDYIGRVVQKWEGKECQVEELRVTTSLAHNLYFLMIQDEHGKQAYQQLIQTQ